MDVTKFLMSLQGSWSISARGLRRLNRKALAQKEGRTRVIKKIKKPSKK